MTIKIEIEKQRLALIKSVACPSVLKIGPRAFKSLLLEEGLPESYRLHSYDGLKLVEIAVHPDGLTVM